MQWTAPQGFFGPLAMIALPVQRVPPALRRRRAKRWPRSWSRRARTARASRGRTGTTGRSPSSEYLAAPMIADPICRFDCDIPVDGVADVRAHLGRAGARPPAPAGVRRRLRERRSRRRDRLPLHWPLDDIMDGGAETARRLWAHAGRRPRRRRPAPGLRRLLAVRLVLARGARLLPGRARRTVRAGRRHRQRRARRAARRCRAAARSATAACTASPRCSSATCSSRVGPGTASGTCRSGSPAIPRRTSAARCLLRGADGERLVRKQAVPVVGRHRLGR